MMDRGNRCYNEDGSDYDSGNFDWRKTYIPKVEQEWLKLDLKKTQKKTIIFVHQRFDIDYFTFQAVVEGQGLENNAYSLIYIRDNGAIKVEGFGKQNSV
jgi:hypothetical protein